MPFDELLTDNENIKNTIKKCREVIQKVNSNNEQLKKNSEQR